MRLGDRSAEEAIQRGDLGEEGPTGEEPDLGSADHGERREAEQREHDHATGSFDRGADAVENRPRYSSSLLVLAIAPARLASCSRRTTTARAVDLSRTASTRRGCRSS